LAYSFCAFCSAAAARVRRASSICLRSSSPVLAQDTNRLVY
jgi:hypothetical protein